jgi:hypothetical protein
MHLAQTPSLNSNSLHGHHFRPAHPLPPLSSSFWPSPPAVPPGSTPSLRSLIFSPSASACYYHINIFFLSSRKSACIGVGASSMMQSGAAGDSSTRRRGAAGAPDTGAERHSAGSGHSGGGAGSSHRGVARALAAGPEGHGLQAPKSGRQAAAAADPSRAEPHAFRFAW